MLSKIEGLSEEQFNRLKEYLQRQGKKDPQFLADTINKMHEYNNSIKGRISEEDGLSKTEVDKLRDYEKMAYDIDMLDEKILEEFNKENIENRNSVKLEDAMQNIKSLGEKLEDGFEKLKKSGRSREKIRKKQNQAIEEREKALRELSEMAAQLRSGRKINNKKFRKAWERISYSFKEFAELEDKIKGSRAEDSRNLIRELHNIKKQLVGSAKDAEELSEKEEEDVDENGKRLEEIGTAKKTKF